MAEPLIYVLILFVAALSIYAAVKTSGNFPDKWA